MDGKLLARICAVVFVAIVLTATVIDRTRQAQPPQVSRLPVVQLPTDPLRATLRHCQHLGEAASNEAECLSAWAQSRDRFLGRPTTPAAPQGNEGE